MLDNETVPDELSEVDKLRSEAYGLAQHAFATAYIFERRANRLRRKINFLSFVGVAVPLIIGALVLSFGQDYKPLGWAIPVAAGIGVVQLIYSLWSVFAGWVASYDHAVRAIVTNQGLVKRYETLGKRETTDAAELRQQLDFLKTIDAIQEESDYRQGVTGAEKRMGMHALLRQYEKECTACKKTPTDMKSAHWWRRNRCGVCDDYPRRWARS